MHNSSGDLESGTNKIGHYKIEIIFVQFFTNCEEHWEMFLLLKKLIIKILLPLVFGNWKQPELAKYYFSLKWLFDWEKNW